MNENKIIQIVRLLVFIIFSILSLGLIMSYRAIDSSHMLHHFLTIICSICTVLSAWRIKFKDLAFGLNKKLIILISASLIVGSSVMTREMNKRGIWIDEYTQFKKSATINNKKGLIEQAAIEHQPPATYIFSYLSYTFFGYSEVGIRLFSITSYLTLCILVPVFIFYLFSTLKLSLLSTSFFFTLISLNFYSIEGRPFIFITLLSMLYISLMTLKDKKKLSLDFFFLTFLLAISSSVQTVFLPISLVAIESFYCARNKLKKLYIAHIAAAILYVPFAYIIYLKSVETYNIKDSITLLGSLESLKVGLSLWSQYIYNISKTLLGTFIISLIGSLAFKGALAKVARSYSLFTLTVFFFFAIFVNWNIYPRYIIIMNIFAIFMVTLIIKLASMRIKLIVVIFLIPLISIDIVDYFRYDQHFQSHVRTKQMLNYLDKVSTNDDIAILYNFNNIGYWRAATWFSKEIYLKKKSLRTVKEGFGEENIPYIRKDYFNKNTKHVFIVQRWQWNKLSIIKFIPKENIVSTRRIDRDYTVTKTNINTYEKWYDFQDKLKDKLPKNYAHSTFEALIFHSIRASDMKLFLDLIKQYDDLFKSTRKVKKERNLFQRDLEKIRKNKRKQFIDYFKEYNNHLKLPRNT